ncbi:MAG: SMI1/KNR4 family protein [Myxococcales bacterium]|nr:SMI1/KNR4 family protein [Myxococcales bacterium]MCB9569291.1 SMI1/KNR4 family protein [Myxococcales bacterium]
MTSSPLLFHGATFDLVGQRPLLAPALAAEIERVEARLGWQLPASVREWYSIVGIDEFREEFSTPNFQVALARLGVDDDDDELLAERPELVRFMDENQGVGAWAFDRASGADPRVFAQSDGGEPWDDSGLRFAEFQFEHTVEYLTYFDWTFQRRLEGPRPLIERALAVLDADLRRISFPESPVLVRMLAPTGSAADYLDLRPIGDGAMARLRVLSEDDARGVALLRQVEAALAR